MPKTFLCYLHKPNMFTPELRVLACETEEMLPDVLQVHLPMWGAFNAIDVYNDADQAIFRFNRDGRPTH